MPITTAVAASKEAARLARCRALSGPFADYVLTQGPAISRLVPAIILLLINVPICAALIFLSRLADKERSSIRRERRTDALHDAIDEFARVYNGVELLRVAEARRKAADTASISTSDPSNKSTRHDSNSTSSGSSKTIGSSKPREGSDYSHDQVVSHPQTEKNTIDMGALAYSRELEHRAGGFKSIHLTRQESRLDALERRIVKFRTPGAGERVVDWLSPETPSCSVIAVGRRILALLAALILMAISGGAVALAPMAVLAISYCGRRNVYVAHGHTYAYVNETVEGAREDGTITIIAFWILYALLTVAPAVIAWFTAGKAMVHWRRVDTVPIIGQCGAEATTDSGKGQASKVESMCLSPLSSPTSGSPTSATSTSGSPTNPMGRDGPNGERENGESEDDVGPQPARLVQTDPWSTSRVGLARWPSREELAPTAAELGEHVGRRCCCCW